MSFPAPPVVSTSGGAVFWGLKLMEKCYIIVEHAGVMEW